MKTCFGHSVGPHEPHFRESVGTLFFSQTRQDNEKRQVPSSRRGQDHITDAYITALISM